MFVTDSTPVPGFKYKLASENIPVALIGTVVEPCSKVHVPVPDVPPSVQASCSSYTINALA